MSVRTGANSRAEIGEGQYVVTNLIEMLGGGRDFASIAVTTQVNCARTAAPVGWLKILRARAAIHCCADFGTFISRFRR